MLLYILYFLLERRCPQLGPYCSISSVFGRLECLTRVTRTLGSNFNLQDTEVCPLIDSCSQCPKGIPNVQKHRIQNGRVLTEDTGVLVKKQYIEEALNGGVLTKVFQVYHAASNGFPLSVLISVLLAESVDYDDCNELRIEFN